MVNPFMGGENFVSDTLESLAARVRLLEDREALRDLVARYGPLADSGDSAGVSQLWTETGSYTVMGFAAAEGQSAIAGLIQSAEHQSLMADGCAHVLGPIALDIDGDRASARGHSIVFRKSEAGFIVYRMSANHWQFIRTEEGWRVESRTNALLDGSEQARLLLHP
jgi:hypothetical protein